MDSDSQHDFTEQLRAAQQGRPPAMPVSGRIPIPREQWGFQAQGEAKCHFGVITTVFHQQPHEPPVVLDARFSRLLDSSEQSYQRKITLDLDWVPVDLGWFQDRSSEIGLFAIKNEEGRWNAMPSDAERAESARRVLRIGLALPDSRDVIPLFLVRPGESFYGSPAQVGLLRLASLADKTRCTLLLVPG